jgi:signal transduction histidine kinase
VTALSRPAAPARLPGFAARTVARAGRTVAGAVAWLGAEEVPVTATIAAHPALGRRAAALSQRPISLARSHPAAADGVLAAIICGFGAIGVVRSGHGADATVWLFLVALIVPVVWRRRHPVGVFAITYVAAVVQWLYLDRLVVFEALLIALYTVARHTPRRTALAAAAALELGVIVATLTGGFVRSLVYITALLAAVLVLGANLRTRQAYLAALVERAERLERERDQQARIAAAAERASIAREMHDIVAHSLAVIITMAEAAAAKRRSDPDRAGAAMEQVSEVGRQALGETRRLLGVLRTEGPGGGAAPLPGLAQLDALLDQVRATGLAAELTVTGRRFAVPEGAQLAVYRIVQEALTNTIKHARDATRVRVRLRYAEPAIGVDIADDGRPGAAGAQRGAASAQRGATGHGLAGMSERAALYDGTVVAGERAGGGWGVSALLSLSQAGAGRAQPVAS